MTGATNVLGNKFNLASGYTFATAYDIINMSVATVSGVLTISGATFEVGNN